MADTASEVQSAVAKIVLAATQIMLNQQNTMGMSEGVEMVSATATVIRSAAELQKEMNSRNQYIIVEKDQFKGRETHAIDMMDGVTTIHNDHVTTPSHHQVKRRRESSHYLSNDGQDNNCDQQDGNQTISHHQDISIDLNAQPEVGPLMIPADHQQQFCNWVAPTNIHNQLDGIGSPT